MILFVSFVVIITLTFSYILALILLFVLCVCFKVYACIWECGINCKWLLKLGGNLIQIVVKAVLLFLSSHHLLLCSPFILFFSYNSSSCIFFPFHSLFCLSILTFLTSFFMSCSFFNPLLHITSSPVLFSFRPRITVMVPCCNKESGMGEVRGSIL